MARTASIEVTVPTLTECEIEITHYDPGHPGRFSGHPDNWEPPEGSEIEFRVLTPQGDDVYDELSPDDQKRCEDAAYKAARREEV